MVASTLVALSARSPLATSRVSAGQVRPLGVEQGEAFGEEADAVEGAGDGHGVGLPGLVAADDMHLPLRALSQTISSASRASPGLGVGRDPLQHAAQLGRPGVLGRDARGVEGDAVGPVLDVGLGR